MISVEKKNTNISNSITLAAPHGIGDVRETGETDIIPGFPIYIGLKNIIMMMAVIFLVFPPLPNPVKGKHLIDLLVISLKPVVCFKPLKAQKH